MTNPISGLRPTANDLLTSTFSREAREKLEYLKQIESLEIACRNHEKINGELRLQLREQERLTLQKDKEIRALREMLGKACLS